MAGKHHHENLYRGPDALSKLAAVRVTLCGAGALGSNLADTLARQGFRRLRVIDRDRVEEHNVGTQTYGENDVGAWKADVLRGPDGKSPLAVAVGLESPKYADVRKIDPLAPCYRLAAFGTEGRSTKRVNGLFSFLVADPARSLTAGLALLTEACQEMTEGSVEALAAQCPSDAPHLLTFYTRYFREQGRFPEFEKAL